jgi:hypothetical protein
MLFCVALRHILCSVALHYVARIDRSLALSYPALSCPALHWLDLCWKAMCCATSRCFALHCICVALLCVALRCVALRCVALRCVALRCVALRCVALCFIALRGVAMQCDAMQCVVLRYFAFRFVRCLALRWIVCIAAAFFNFNSAHIKIFSFALPLPHRFLINAFPKLIRPASSFCLTSSLTTKELESEPKKTTKHYGRYGIERLDHIVGNVWRMAPVAEYIRNMTGPLPYFSSAPHFSIAPPFCPTSFITYTPQFTGFHDFAEFVAADVGTDNSGLNSIVLANNNEYVLLPINEPTFGTKRVSQIETYLRQNKGEGVQHMVGSCD